MRLKHSKIKDHLSKIARRVIHKIRLYERKSLAYVVRSRKLLGSNRITLIDVGSRGGLPSEWQALSEFTKWIGFEIDKEECQRINKLLKRTSTESVVYPYAISNSISRKTFYSTRLPDSSGFMKGNSLFLKRLYDPAQRNLEVIKSAECDTINLDTFASSHGINNIDFIKIDVEGSEASVLKGAQKILEDYNVLGIKSEIWLGPVKDPNSFAEIDHLLRKNRFHLFDIEMRRYPRNTFPRGYLVQNRLTRQIRLDSTKYGQVLTGDVIYLRDPVWELRDNMNRFRWSDQNVLKMALIYELYRLYDCAVEILNEYEKNFNSALPFQVLCDALTPKINFFKKPRYDDYIRMSKTKYFREMETYKKAWRLQ